MPLETGQVLGNKNKRALIMKVGAKKKKNQTRPQCRYRHFDRLTFFWKGSGTLSFSTVRFLLELHYKTRQFKNQIYSFGS